MYSPKLRAELVERLYSICQEVVQGALEAVPVENVRTWMKETFGKSARVKRKEAFSIPANTEQKPDQFRLSA